MSWPVEEALAAVGSPQEILERHGFTVRRKVAVCPFHEDRNPSLSVFEDRNGKPRWKCHGCQRGGDSIDLARLLGERVEVGRPARPKPAKSRPSLTPAQRDLTRILNRREAIAFEVAAALTLARVHREAAMQEVELNRPWLQEQGSVELIVELADRLRSWLFERYGIPAGFVWLPATVWAGFEELASDGS